MPALLKVFDRQSAERAHDAASGEGRCPAPKKQDVHKNHSEVDFVLIFLFLHCFRIAYKGGVSTLSTLQKQYREAIIFERVVVEPSRIQWSSSGGVSTLDIFYRKK